MLQAHATLPIIVLPKTGSSTEGEWINQLAHPYNGILLSKNKE
jgi:hypothetical protein